MSSVQRALDRARAARERDGLTSTPIPVSLDREGLPSDPPPRALPWGELSAQGNGSHPLTVARASQPNRGEHNSGSLLPLLRRLDGRMTERFHASRQDESIAHATRRRGLTPDQPGVWPVRSNLDSTRRASWGLGVLQAGVRRWRRLTAALRS
jgi:hypothetical protein